MSENNGSTNSPAKSAVRSIAELGHDTVTLAELQVELFKSELRQTLQAIVKPLMLLVVGLVAALGCVPVCLFTLAHSLIEWAELSQPLSFLISALVGLITAGLAMMIGLRRLRHDSMRFERSRDEFLRNVRWIKQVLKNRASPANCRCQQQRTPSQRI